ncbi:MAG TPA: hypothetical protein VFV71_10775 [Burkholderiales bacterium]|nr:hypothetical protein [Burkholderiales bacterium]
MATVPAWRAWTAGCAAALPLLASPCASGAEWGLDATAAAQYDDNLPNAIEAADRKSDLAALFTLSGLLHGQPGDSTGASIGLVMESLTQGRFHDLDNLALGARASMRHKFGLGPDVPWVSIALGALHHDYNYDYRDGWRYEAGLTAGVRPAERLDLSAVVQYDRFEADRLQPAILPGVSTAAYDVAGWTFGARAGWLATEADTLLFSLSRRHGTVTAVTPPVFEILEYSSAVALDPVFDGNPIAYRVAVDSDTLAVGWAHALSSHVSIGFTYAYRHSSDQDADFSYRSNLVNLSLSYTR